MYGAHRRSIMGVAAACLLLAVTPSTAAARATYPTGLRGPVLSLDAAIRHLPHHTKHQLRVRRSLLSGLHTVELQLRRRHGCVARRQLSALRKRLRASAVKPQSADAANVQPIAQDNPIPTPPFWGRRRWPHHRGTRPRRPGSGRWPPRRCRN